MIPPEEQTAAYRYGWLIGTCSALIFRLPRNEQNKAQYDWEGHSPDFLRSTVFFPELMTHAGNLVKRLAPDDREAARKMIDDALSAVGEWEPLTSPRHLTTDEQAEVIVGMRQARYALRPVNAPAGSLPPADI